MTLVLNSYIEFWDATQALENYFEQLVNHENYDPNELIGEIRFVNNRWQMAISTAQQEMNFG